LSQPFPDLVGLFDDLPAPTSNVGLGRFCANPVPDFPACAVGKDGSGRPVLLIQADNAQPGVPAPMALEHLSVIHLVNCRVQAPGQAERERTLSVIRCTEGDRAFHEYFLRSLHPVVASLPEHPSRLQISGAIERLIDLFRQITQAPRKAIAGLWAELLVIALADNPAALLACWRAAPEDRFDFASGPDRLDVKGASGGQRAHYFSLDQLRPPTPTRVLIASILVERAEGGTSANDLVDIIRSRVADPEMLVRLDSVVAQTVGQDWRSMEQVRFDRELALSSLRLLDSADIPCVPLPLPPEVADVRFRVDLSRHALPFPHRLTRSSELFRAAARGAASSQVEEDPA
jgi:hypothetical protein